MSNEIALAHTLVGTPASQTTTFAHSAGGREVAYVPAYGAEFEGHTRCHAKNFTCQGSKVKGQDYCIGHMRSAAAGRSVD